MVNATLNWASASALALFIWIPLLTIAGIEKISRANKSKLFLWVLVIGRYVLGILSASIMFFQGWRLDPILQLGQTFLVAGIIAESYYGTTRDGFCWNGESKRYRAEYEWAKSNNKVAPKKSIWAWYFIALASTTLPFFGNLIVFIIASKRFSRVEKQLAELRNSITRIQIEPSY